MPTSARADVGIGPYGQTLYSTRPPCHREERSDVAISRYNVPSIPRT